MHPAADYGSHPTRSCPPFLPAGDKEYIVERAALLKLVLQHITTSLPGLLDPADVQAVSYRWMRICTPPNATQKQDVAPALR